MEVKGPILKCLPLLFVIICLYTDKVQSRMCSYRTTSSETYCTCLTKYECDQRWGHCYKKYRMKYVVSNNCCHGYETYWNWPKFERKCKPICNGKTGSTACNAYFYNSHIINIDGSIQRRVDGTCVSPNRCTCSTLGFYSTGPTCDICSPIANCNQETCTSKTNQVCSRCEGVVGEQTGFRAYVVSKDRKQCNKACSWRSDSTPCYPGTCEDELVENCNCSQGFNGTKCDNIMEGPTILHNILRIRGSNGDITEVPGDSNAGPPQDIVWTNILNPDSLDFSFTTVYTPDVPTTSRPAYIKDFKVGIIGGEVTLKIVKVVFPATNNLLQGEMNSTETNMTDDGFTDGHSVAPTTEPVTGGYIEKKTYTAIFPCFINASEDNPIQEIITCQQTVKNLTELSAPFNHQDILEVSFSVSNGGFIVIEDKERKIITKKYLKGVTRTHTFLVGFDNLKPYHCKPALNCTEHMLYVADYSRQTTITISWDGWFDDDAGIAVYEYEIFELQYKDNMLSENRRVRNHKTSLNNSDITLPSVPGVYCVILSAKDNAGNHKSARRIVVFDDSSNVTPTKSSFLRVTTALSATNYTWQTDLNTVNISWSNRYQNVLHQSGHYLAEVKSNPQVETEYDDHDGLRTIKAITNKKGIIKFEMTFNITSLSGNLATQPRDEDFTDIGLDEQVVLKPNLQDGDTLQYFIRAYDVVLNYLQESTTVHFDSSPPVIENLWLTKGGEVNISVHGLAELNKMVIEWLAYDDHSGLKEVEWKLYDNQTQIIHGSQKIPPQGEATNIEDCERLNANTTRGANCYCILSGSCFHRNFRIEPTETEKLGHGIFSELSKGDHDHDYHIEVTVINNAHMSTTVTKKITVDTSPPHEGVVHDGKYGNPEVDFQTDLELFGHWEGFFDRESGVKFYQYGFASDCLDSGAFDTDLHNTKDIVRTFSTHASWKAPNDSTYYITVVAYNRALEPSKPVCSDGVTIDRTPPVVSEIDVDGARIKGGLVKKNNTVYYISDSRRRYLIKDPDVQCISKALEVNTSELNLFPLERWSNGSIHSMSAGKQCHKQPMQTVYLSKTYLAMHSHLYVNWTGTDPESGIYDYEFGLSSTKGSASVPDYRPFTSTHHHPWYRAYHPKLSNGTEFFIIIKAINKAGNSRIQVLGPIIVQRRKPYLKGEIFVHKVNHVLEVNWSGGISDPEPTDLKMEAAIGSSAGSQDVLPYSGLAAGGDCILTTPPNCTAFNIDDLHWNLHHTFTYYVSLKVENIVGLSNVFVSRPYIHNARLPSRGVVYEVVMAEEEKYFTITKLEDSNFQLSTSKLSARWFGFESDDLQQHVTYRVGVGSRPQITDIVKEISVGNKTTYTFLGLNLVIHQTYYITVIAKTYGGVINVSSNGVTIVKTNVDLGDVVQVNDGPVCHTGDDSFTWRPNHHIQQNITENCGLENDYQLSTSVYMAHWTISSEYQHIYPSVKWALQIKLQDTVDLWTDVMEKQFLFNDGEIVQPVSLETCKTYRSSVRFCSDGVCSLPIVSDGVKLLEEPSKPKLHVDYTSGTDYKLKVVLTYVDDESGGLCAFNESDVDKYMWSITDNKHESHLLTRWNLVSNIQNINTHQFIIDLEEEVDFSKCRRVSVRIFNKVGLSTTVSSDIRNCTAIDPRLIVPSIVIDVIGEPVNANYNTNEQGSPITLEENAMWLKHDVDYTPYSNIISAVWPTLRYSKYKWGLLQGGSTTTVAEFMDFKINITDPCSFPDFLACGETGNNFINILKPLKHGRRYHVCLYADKENIQHEKWREELEQISVCSDGVTVDLTSPTGGQVWVKNLQNSTHQPSNSEVSVYWDSFVDIEDGGLSIHPSGIAYYNVAIGSIAGGGDIVSKRRVGLINHKIFHRLSLQDGHTYYITVEAVDFVNRSKTVYSDGFIVDNSPPHVSDKPIRFTNTYLQLDDIVSVCWSESFDDRESGINQYKWSIGSRPGHQDVMTYNLTTSECNQVTLEYKLLDGHTYYVTVIAFNGAGMSNTLISRPITVDTSPPTTGYVIDVIHSNITGNDVDYVIDQSTLSVRWQGFHDPHSMLNYYRVKLGTCDDCDDVMEEIKTGTYPQYIFPRYKLIPGTKYITTVTACNMAALCTTAYSDGVVVDVTPPIPGRVLDGTKDLDIDFQATRNYVGAKWYGFKDVESGIERYEWRVGTTKGGDELMEAERLPVVEIAYISDLPDELLPNGTRIYITVRCYNKAGLYSESTSNGFVVDIKPPDVTKKVTMSSTSASILADTTISRSSLTVKWQFTDDQSNIEKQYISLSPHVMGDFNASSSMIPSMLTEYTYTSLELHDGSKYKVKVIGCNLAGLCTSTSTDDITVDSSPPTRGMFAIATDHAANLNRHRDNWMRWSTNAINISWLGFSDLHTGIIQYNVNIGTKPFFNDLNKNNREARFQHVSGDRFDDEGVVQMVSVETVDLQSSRSVFISVWAVNGVGLKSQPIYSEFLLVGGGILDLVRRCNETHSCTGLCVCSAQDKKCPEPKQPEHKCQNPSTDTTDTVIEVRDVTDLRSSSVDQANYTTSDNFLAARWKVTKQQGAPAIRYEVSAGYLNESTPTAIYTTHSERVWFDVGQNTDAIFSLSRDKELKKPQRKYCVFVKAWYSSNRFAVFKSPGIILSKSAPGVSYMRGAAVKELTSSTTNKDIDFQSFNDTLIVGWKNKFIQGFNGIDYYRAYISTHPLGHNIHQSASGLTVNIYRAGDSNLEENQEYYTTVLAYNKAGLVSWASSDGITIDVTRPLSGIVHDGDAIYDKDYSSSVTSVSASWYGFTDTGSGIESYYWCIGTDDSSTDCSIKPWTNVGLYTRINTNLSTPLTHGTSIYHKVYAVDGSGLKSNVTVSNGLNIDITPPNPVDVKYIGDNLISNPSFEEGPGNTTAPANWVLDPTSHIDTIHSHASKERNTYVKIRGQIQQTVSNLSSETAYNLIVHVGYPHDVSLQNHIIEGFVQFGNERQTFNLDPQMCQGLCDVHPQPLILWNKYTYVFHPTKSTEVIIIGTNNIKMELAVDDVYLLEVNYIDITSDSNHLIYRTVFTPYWSALHLTWHFTDDHSPIVDYKWALGTVKGGTQIKPFSSVGRHHHVTISDLTLTHNTELYVTVVATNEAGLSTVSQSESVIVDMTPPMISEINDGVGRDVNFQSSRIISVNWQVEDTESGIDYCVWAIGTSPVSVDIQPFLIIQDGRSFGQTEINETLRLDGKKVYSTIRCFNKAGLPTTATTNGVLIVRHMSDNGNGYLNILKDGESPYPVRDECLPTNDSIRLKWMLSDGRVDSKSVQVSVHGEESTLDREVGLTDIFYNLAKLTGLTLKPKTWYNISISTINVLDIQSNVLSTNISTADQAPVIQDLSGIHSMADGKNMTISWENVFSSSWKHLYYEVSLGSISGSADVIQWQETRVPSLTFHLPSRFKSGELYLTITAIDPCGLYTHLIHTIIL